MKELKRRMQMVRAEINALQEQHDAALEQYHTLNVSEDYDDADMMMTLAEYLGDVIGELRDEACDIDAEIRRLETAAALEQISAYTDAVLQQVAAL